MAAFDILTIGHSNSPADRFVELLQGAGVTVLADVRSVPFSRWCPWFSRQPLSDRLARETIAYLPMGDTLGGRPRDPLMYSDGVVDYEAMAQTPEFRGGLARVTDEVSRERICLMCAERDPLDCHRFLLIARVLAEQGWTIGHILGDGTIEPQAATEQRLLAVAGGGADLFGDAGERVADAYRRRARGIGARRKT
jgi:uncharacterized protein (DUF488 family)